MGPRGRPSTRESIWKWSSEVPLSQKVMQLGVTVLPKGLFLDIGMVKLEMMLCRKCQNCSYIQENWTIRLNIKFS